MMIDRALSRRDFLRTTSMAGLGAWLGFAGVTSKSPNERLNLGVIGTANRAATNLSALRGENIVALCDVDEHFLRSTAAAYPQAKRYTDFRKLLEQKDVDAVVLSTPDHTHAVATLMALKSGRHVYCEKPLTYSVHEARLVAQAAAETGRCTQMGIQIHAERNYRRVVEMIRTGAIGTVRAAHVFCSKDWGGDETPAYTRPAPSHLNYDLWLGPAPERPYNPAYLPLNWRRWWDFGGGTLGDMGCHYMDLVHWALELRHPETIEAEGPPVHRATTPHWLVVRYQYPARGQSPPVQVTWYDGGKRPDLITRGEVPSYKNGVLFVGDQGMLFADYRQRLLLPESKFEDYQEPTPFLPDSKGHHQEWIEACKSGEKTSCNFDYSGALTEAILLGNVAYRTGKKLQWDPAKLRAVNCPEADAYLRREYRAGWAI